MLAAVLLTLAIFALILRRVPFRRAGRPRSRDADYAAVPRADDPEHAVLLRVGHARADRGRSAGFTDPVAYRDLLPVRAASYVVGFFNTNLGRGAMAAYLSRRLQAPFLELGSTVIFLVLTEYTQLVLWAMLGLLGFRAEVSRSLLAVAAGVAIALAGGAMAARAARVGASSGHSGWRRRRASPRSCCCARRCSWCRLCLHYYAAHAFGIHIPFSQLLTFLPVIFMLAALPVTVAHLGTTQAAWIFFFSALRAGAAPPGLQPGRPSRLRVDASAARSPVAAVGVPRSDSKGAKSTDRDNSVTKRLSM